MVHCCFFQFVGMAHVIGSFLRQAETTQDYALLTSRLLGLVGCSAERMHDGVYELSGLNVGLVQFAVNQEACFFAARWSGHLLSEELALTCEQPEYEVFMVAPANRPVQVGLRVIGLAGQLLEPPAWWLALSPSASPPAPAPVPSFIVLAGTLSGLSYGCTAHTQETHEAQLLRQQAEIEYLLQLLQEQRQTHRHLKAALSASRSSLQALTTSASAQEDDEQELEAFEDLVDWCSEHAETITVLPRALHGAKKSQYEDPTVLTACLRLLEGPYRAYRKGQLSKDALTAQLQELGLRLSGSVAPSIAGEHGDDYFVKWRGRRWLMDAHLAKGGGRDQRYCLRVYFFWDPDLERVVVGEMPAHLANSLT